MISVWIGCSSSVILFNKYLLDTLNFRTFTDMRSLKTNETNRKEQPTPLSSPPTTSCLPLS